MGQAIVLDEGACTSSPRNVCYSGNSLVLADRRSPGFWLKPIERRHRFELRGIFWRCRTIIGRLATLSAPCDPEELFLSGNRDLHLTPARFRSRGRLFWRTARKSNRLNPSHQSA